MKPVVYTVGHSTHPIGRFIEILKKNNINCVCDVRSTPFSAYNPQFNSDTLKQSLLGVNIRYVDFGKEFGARRDELVLYTNGVVDFTKVASSQIFMQGVSRVKDGIKKGYRMAIMCSEKDPIECHRTVLVSRNLQKYSIEIIHILENGDQEKNCDTEERLVKKYLSKEDRFFGGTLFDANVFEDIQIDRAYEAAEKKIAYKMGEEE